MPGTSEKENFSVHKENISYYDEIADSYDSLLEQEDSNKIIRQKVKEKLTGLLQSGWVLDFGGGTGLDLEWLKAHNYHIIFCEPSVVMREKAIQHSNRIPTANSRIIFLDTVKTNFATWHQELPFSQHVDAVLANFGVVNNIQDIDLLFRNLSLIMKPGAHFIAIFLERPFKRMLKWNLRNAVRSFFFNKKFVMYTWYERHRQTVFVHTTKEIKIAAAPFFDYSNCEFLGGFGFNLIHLIRK